LPSGVEYDLYEPAGAERTFVSIGGVTIKGARDHRLVNFSRCMAESGIRTAVIDLPAMSSLRFEESDLEAIIELVLHLHERHGRVGATGFSFGAGLALCAAADPRVSEVLDPLVLFGSYHSFVGQWEKIVERYGDESDREEDLDNFVWLKMLIAYHRLDELGLSDGDREELVDILGNYCSEPSMERKVGFYRRALSPMAEELNKEFDRIDRAALETLSPAGRLSSYPGRVALLHDSHDDLIDPTESENIYEELVARERGRQWLVITPLLSHVTATRAWRVIDLVPILGAMGEMFR